MASKTGNKTKPTKISPAGYVAALNDPVQRADSEWLMEMMQRVVGEPAKMWGSSIIGFGQYHYKYESGREGDSMLAGFAPRKGNIVVYLIGRIADQSELLDRLGPYRMGKACLYLKKLERIDKSVLEELVAKSVKAIETKYTRVSGA